MGSLWREVAGENDLRLKVTSDGQLHGGNFSNSPVLSRAPSLRLTSTHNLPKSFNLRPTSLACACLTFTSCNPSLESCTRRLALSPWPLRRERAPRPRSIVRQQFHFISNSSTVSTTFTISPNTVFLLPRAAPDLPVDPIRFADQHLPQLLLRFLPTSRSTHGSRAHYVSSHSFSHQRCPHYFLIRPLAPGSVSG